VIKFFIILVAVLLVAGCGGSGSAGLGGDSGLAALAGGPGAGGPAGGNPGGGPVGGGAHINPEPTTMTLFAIGLGGLAASAYKKRKQKKG